MSTAMIIDAPGVLDGGAAPVLKRMQLAQVPVLICDDQAPDLGLLGDAAAAVVGELAPCDFPKAKGLLLAMQEHGLDPASSWLITTREAGLKAAEQAGLRYAVWIGDELPEKLPLITVKQANNLADAPRVMIPDAGGCWHDHRS